MNVIVEHFPYTILIQPYFRKTSQFALQAFSRDQNCFLKWQLQYWRLRYFVNNDVADNSWTSDDTGIRYSPQWLKLRLLHMDAGKSSAFVAKLRIICTWLRTKVQIHRSSKSLITTRSKSVYSTFLKDFLEILFVLFQPAKFFVASGSVSQKLREMLEFTYVAREKIKARECRASGSIA